MFRHTARSSKRVLGISYVYGRIRINHDHAFSARSLAGILHLVRVQQSLITSPPFHSLAILSVQLGEDGVGVLFRTGLSAQVASNVLALGNGL